MEINWKFSQKSLVIALASLFCLCIATSLLGFKITQNSFPTLLDIFLSHTFLMPIAIPKAFGDLLGITNIHSLNGTIPMVFAYWFCILILLWYMVRLNSVTIFIILSLVSLSASFQWQVVASTFLAL